MANFIDQVFGQYHVKKPLGKGSMAEVYRAVQSSLKRDVAMKFINETSSERDELVKRFHREMDTVAALCHPHIVKIFDASPVDTLPLYFVMELVEGSDLSSYLKEHRLLPLETISLWLDQIASALDYAHGKDIVHRDLKPANVLLAPIPLR